MYSLIIAVFVVLHILVFNYSILSKALSIHNKLFYNYTNQINGLIMIGLPNL